jgi:excisionase family DNA binding protein
MAQKPKHDQQVKKDQGIQNPMFKRLYTLKEAAMYLGRSDWGMRELIWSGKIPVVKPDGGRKIFIDIMDLNNYVEVNKTIYH